MDYVKKIPAKLQLGAGAVDSLVATGVHSYSFIVGSQCGASRLMATITTLTATNTVLPVVTFIARPIPGSATGQYVLGTLTIPNASPVGRVVYKDLDPQEIKPGTEIVFNVTTAGTDSGAAAGQAVYDVELEQDPEVPANQTSMVASV